MTADLTIRRASWPKDIESILELDAITFFNPWTRAMYEAEGQRRTISHFFVATARAVSTDHPEHLVAYCAAWLLVDELHINNVAVHPDWRRQGIGRTLLERTLAEAARGGAPRATLEVRASNAAARNLYERLGFEVRGVRTSYYTQPAEDALILWRDTGGPHASVADARLEPVP